MLSIPTLMNRTDLSDEHQLHQTVIESNDTEDVMRTCIKRCDGKDDFYRRLILFRHPDVALSLTEEERLQQTKHLGLSMYSHRPSMDNQWKDERQNDSEKFSIDRALFKTPLLTPSELTPMAYAKAFIRWLKKEYSNRRNLGIVDSVGSKSRIEDTSITRGITSSLGNMRIMDSSSEPLIRIIEIGPGTGSLAKAIAQQLPKEWPELSFEHRPIEYVMIERSPLLHAHQRQLLSTYNGNNMLHNRDPLIQFKFVKANVLDYLENLATPSAEQSDCLTVVLACHLASNLAQDRILHLDQEEAERLGALDIDRSGNSNANSMGLPLVGMLESSMVDRFTSEHYGFREVYQSIWSALKDKERQRLLDYLGFAQRNAKLIAEMDKARFSVFAWLSDLMETFSTSKTRVKSSAEDAHNDDLVLSEFRTSRTEFVPSMLYAMIRLLKTKIPDHLLFMADITRPGEDGGNGSVLSVRQLGAPMVRTCYRGIGYGMSKLWLRRHYFDYQFSINMRLVEAMYADRGDADGSMEGMSQMAKGSATVNDHSAFMMKWLSEEEIKEYWNEKATYNVLLDEFDGESILTLRSHQY